MKSRHVISVCLLLLALAACNSPQRRITPPQEDILYQVDNFWAKKPDSALRILDTLNISMLSEEERAHYCLLKVSVRDAFFLYDAETDSLAQVAEDYFIGSKNMIFKAATCEMLSRLAFKEGKGEQLKLDWLLKALQSMEQCQTVDKRLLNPNKNESEQDLIDSYKNKIRMRLGMCYLDNKYSDESLPYLQAAYNYFTEKQQVSSQFNAALALGCAYLPKRDYDSCILYYSKGLEAAKQLDNKELEACYYAYMSMMDLIRFTNGDYDGKAEGDSILRQGIKESHTGLALYEGPMFRYKDGLYDNLGNLYFLLEEYDSCAYYSEKQIDFLNKMNFEIVANPTNAEMYRRLFMSYIAMGDFEKAANYSTLYSEMATALKEQPKAVEQVKNDYEKNMEALRLQAKRQEARYRFYIILALLLVVVVVILWVSYRLRKEKEMEALKANEAYQLLLAEFEKNAQQTQQALQQRVMAIYQSGEANPKERIMTEFETTYPLAVEKMKSSYPELNESERNLVILSFLGFRMKEEADILGLSLNTVEKYRTNIKKKTHSAPISSLIQ